LLSASQQPEAIVTLDKAIESVSEDNTLLSQLQSFKGWLYMTLALSEARSKETAEEDCWVRALEALDTAIKLGNLASRFLYCNTMVAMMSRDAVRGNVEFANQAIAEIISRLIETEEAVDKQERILGHLLVIEVIFRRGPRGFSMEDMSALISERLVKADEMMKESGDGEHRHAGLISDTREWAASMLEMVESQMKK
jgi:hypothetical protein